MQHENDIPKTFHPQMPPSTAWALKELINKGFNVSVGRYTYGTPTVSWSHGDKKQRLIIGSFCSIAPGVSIYVGMQGRHATDYISTYPIGMIFGAPIRRDISNSMTGNLDVIIGNDVWLGRDSLVLAGVTIGDGAVIAARSVVTKNVDPYAIVGGVPAKLIRFRFDPDIILDLLKLQWWNWSDDKIKKYNNIFFTTDVRGAIRDIKFQEKI